jgi:hypothetical protein
MRTLTRVVLCCLVAATTLYAQRGMGHGGFGGGGFRGGAGGFHGGFGGGFRGGAGGFHGGFGGFHGNRIIVRRGFGFGGYWGWPGWGWGWPAAYWPGDYGYGYGYGGYPAYYSAPAPNVTVVYPAQPPPVPVYAGSTPTVISQYDQDGQEVTSALGARVSSPVYLIALKNHVIYAANSYSIKGDTLYFMTAQHESKSTPLIMVDRDLSARLNRERNVQFQLP